MTEVMTDTPSVRVIRDAEALEELRDTWQSLEFGHTDARLDVFLSVVASMPEAERPHVIVRAREGELPGVLVARLETRAMPARFGYATVFKPRLRCLTVVAGGTAASETAHGELVEQLLLALDRKEADAVVLHRVEVDSPLYRETVGRSSRWMRQGFAVPTKHRVMDLPTGVEGLLPSLPKRLRDNFKRSRKLVEREFGERALVRRFDGLDDLDKVTADIESIAATTYQRGLGAGFDADRDREIVALGLADGWWRAWVLYVDGTPRAFELGTQHGDRFIIGAKGYDPGFARHDVGTALQLRVLEELASDPGIRTIDFGFGDADYKRRLATRDWDEVDVVVYGRTARALSANAGRSLVIVADRLARRIAGADRIAHVKRRWREFRTPARAAS